MDYRCSMSPRFWRTTCDNRGGSHITRTGRGSRSVDRFGRPPIAKPKVENPKQFLASGKGVRQVAKMAGISPASVSRIKTSMTGDVTRL